MTTIKITEYMDFEIQIDTTTGLFSAEGMTGIARGAITSPRTTMKGIKKLIDIIYRDSLI